MKNDEPIPGMDKRKSKAQSLYLKEAWQWFEEAPGEERGSRWGYSVRTDYPHFAQIPQALIRDPNIPHAAIRLYGIYHSYTENKDLRNRPNPFVSQERVARNMGIGRDRVSYWTNFLKKEGWLTIRRRGLNKTNEIILHGRRRRRYMTNFSIQS